MPSTRRLWGGISLLVVGAACGSSKPQTAAPLSVQAPRAVPERVPEVSPKPAPPPAATEEEPQVTLVRFSLETTTAAVVPGDSFWLAARWRVAPGYRIFWVNPGDVGRPTRVQFSAPVGFELSEVRYPPPTKFELPDGGVSYGYAGDTAAFAQVRATPDLDPSASYRFDAEASWLACQERCYPESTRAFIEFGVSQSSESVPLDAGLQPLFDSLPLPLGELSGVSYQWRRGGRLHVSAAHTRWLDFFPARAEDPKLVEVATNARKGELELRFENGSPGTRVEGLAVADGAEGKRYVNIDIPWPE